MSRSRGGRGGQGRGAHASEHEGDTWGRVQEVLAGFAPGVHWLGEPAYLLDTALPAVLTELYQRFDGAELFHGTLVLVPSSQIVSQPSGHAGSGRASGPDEPCYRMGELAGDDLFTDAQGRVWRLEKDTDEWLEEGSRLDRWLLGTIEAEAMLYDRDGEFVEEAFDDSGEVLPDMSERMLRRVLKRDRGALAPRWRLAQALVRQDKLEAARAELEEVVAQRPSFAWAWFDLARISERLDDLAGALDEVRAAAEAQPGYEYTGFFWAHAARLAAAMGNEIDRAAYARKALALDPGIVQAQREGAAASLDAGEPTAALALAELAAALAPLDLTILELMARIRTRLEQAGDDSADELDDELAEDVDDDLDDELDEDFDDELDEDFDDELDGDLDDGLDEDPDDEPDRGGSGSSRVH